MDIEKNDSTTMDASSPTADESNATDPKTDSNEQESTKETPASDKKPLSVLERDVAMVEKLVPLFRQQLEPQPTATDKNNHTEQNDNTQKTVQTIFQAVRQDVQSMVKIVEQTELEVMTHLKQLREHKARYQRYIRKGNDEELEIDKDLGCSETLEPTGEPLSKAELRQQATVAAQEIVMIRETARRIRKRARELCMRRVRSKNATNHAY